MSIDNHPDSTQYRTQWLKWVCSSAWCSCTQECLSQDSRDDGWYAKRLNALGSYLGHWWNLRRTSLITLLWTLFEIAGIQTTRHDNLWWFRHNSNTQTYCYMNNLCTDTWRSSGWGIYQRNLTAWQKYMLSFISITQTINASASQNGHPVLPIHTSSHQVNHQMTSLIQQALQVSKASQTHMPDPVLFSVYPTACTISYDCQRLTHVGDDTKIKCTFRKWDLNSQSPPPNTKDLVFLRLCLDCYSRAVIGHKFVPEQL